MPNNIYRNKIQELEKGVKKWKYKREKVKSDLRILIKKREVMQNTLRAYQGDVLNTQQVASTHDNMCMNKIGNLEEEIRALKMKN